jgi:hypothetical protein
MNDIFRFGASNKIKVYISLWLFAGLSFATLAGVHIADNKGFSLDLYGNIHVQAEEILRADRSSSVYDYDSDRYLWSPAGGIRLGLRPVFSHRLLLDFAIDWISRFDTYYSRNGSDDPGSFFHRLKLFNASAKYALGSPERISTGIEAGFFHFRYNQDSKNLGEYLMRSGAISLLGRDALSTEFENEGAQLLGLRLSNDFFTIFHHDLLFYYGNFHDLSLDHLNFAYLIDSRFTWGLAAGLGINFNSRAEPQGSPYYTENSWDTGSFIRWVDTISTPASVKYDTDPIRLSAHLSFDLKRLFSGKSIAQAFGEQDLKIYGEATMLGNGAYDGARLLPVSFGINIPGFKLLWDVMSFELEYFRGNADRGMPLFVPDSNSTSLYHEVVMNSDSPWRWSLFCSRKVLLKATILLLIARDHYKIDGNAAGFDLDNKGSWHWILKVRYDL